MVADRGICTDKLEVGLTDIVGEVDAVNWGGLIYCAKDSDDTLLIGNSGVVVNGILGKNGAFRSMQRVHMQKISPVQTLPSKGVTAGVRLDECSDVGTVCLLALTASSWWLVFTSVI